MSNAALSDVNRLQSAALPGTGLFIAVGLAVWFTAVDAVGAATTTQMAHLPLVMVPAFFVPAFIIVHLTAILQARRLAG